MERKEETPQMILSAPVPPPRDLTEKQIVHYMDADSLSEAKKCIETTEKETGRKLYLSYCHEWSDKQGYDISDSEEGCDIYLLTDYDILKSVKAEDGIRCIDGDEIFQQYEMVYSSSETPNNQKIS